MIKEKFILAKKRFFPSLFTTEDMCYFLRQRGIKLGKGTIFYSPGKTTVDTSRPCLLEIGEYCKITAGVIILTHDYSRSVLRRTHGEIIGEAKKTIIGDNVFVGMNSIILMGTKIGSNVIVGAGSVVSGEVPDNVVVAGNPARVIRTIEEHYEIKKKKMLEQAVEYALCFKKANNRWPTVKELDPFFPLFLERDKNVLSSSGVKTSLGGDDEEDVIENFLKSEPVFFGYDEFILFCKGKEEC